MTDTAGQRLSRMLSLVPWLVEHDGVTITEAAQHFGVSDKQLEDDLWLIIMCGVPGYMPDQLIDIDFWDDGRIRVIEPLTLTRPLRLSHEESLTLLVALRLLAQVPHIDNRDAVSSATAKLESALGSIGSIASFSDASDHNEAVRLALDSAGRAPVSITYASGTDDAVTDRVIEVDRTFSVDGIVYLDAYCHRAGARRTFRLDRILSVQAATDDLPQRPRSDIPNDDVVVPEAGSRHVILTLEPEARWLVDVYGAEVVSQDPFTVRLSAHSDAWAVRLVLSLAGAAELLEPQALRQAVLEAARAARAGYPQA